MKRWQVFLVVLIMAAGLMCQQYKMGQIRGEIKELAVAVEKENAATKVIVQDIQERQEELGNNLQIAIYGRPVRASWYGDWEEGRVTASGDVFHKEGYGIAHRTLPFGTVVLFENPDNGRAVPGVVNDRMPFYSDREFDLSASLAEKLGYLEKGVTELQCYYLFLPVEAIR